MRKIDEELLYLFLPENFANEESVIFEKENQFEEHCALLEDCGVKNPHELTVFQFLKRAEYYEKKFLKQQEQIQKHKKDGKA